MISEVMQSIREHIPAYYQLIECLVCSPLCACIGFRGLFLFFEKIGQFFCVEFPLLYAVIVICHDQDPRFPRFQDET